MPIEVPDTRAFSEPPRRRRTVTKPPAPDAAATTEPVPPEEAPAAPSAELVGAGVVAGPAAESAFSKPVRRRKPVVEAVVDPVAERVAEPVVEAAVAAAESAFSKPVRRRPRSSPEADLATGSADAPSETPATDEAAPVAVASPLLIEPAPSAEPSTAAPAIPEQGDQGHSAQPDPGTPTAEPVPAMPAAAANSRVEEAAERPNRAELDELPEVTDTVVVRLAGTRYAVAMDAVAEVGRPPHVTRVPGVPAWIAGVANWRGRIMPVLDLRVLLGGPTADLSVTGRIMVLTRDGVTLAFLAERVEGVVGLELDRLEPVLATLPRSTASVLSGQLAHPDGPIALLDLDTVFALRSQLPRVRRAG